MNYFYVASEVRWTMAETEWPEEDEFQDLLESYKRAFQDKSRGTRVTDIFREFLPLHVENELIEVFDQVKDSLLLDRTLYSTVVDLLARTHGPAAGLISLYSPASCQGLRLAVTVREIRHLNLNRFTYGTAPSNLRNSFVCYKDPLADDPSVSRAGQISRILLHSRNTPDNVRTVEAIFVIQEYTPLSAADEAKDPYRQFPLLNTQLFYNRFQSRSAVVRVCDVKHHFAALVCKPEGFDEECIVVRALDRVCFSHQAYGNRRPDFFACRASFKGRWSFHNP